MKKSIIPGEINVASVIAVCISEKEGTIKSGDAICVDTVAGKV